MLDRQTPHGDPETLDTLRPVREAPGSARRVAVNALSPFAAQVITKVLMLGYLILQYRLIGGNTSNPLGDYFLAGVVFLYTSTIADWGLGTLLMREAARDRGVEDGASRAATFFGETLALRVFISLALFVPVAIFTALYLAFFHLSTGGAWAIALLTISLVPGTFSGAATALIYAYERMSLAAAISVVSALVNVALGVAALLLGWGVPGLAGAALVTTCITALVFWLVLRARFPELAVRPDGGLRLKRGAAGALLKAGWPLMLNALLVGLFFRADTFVIEGSAGGLALERYNAAYSYLNFVLLITPAVTLALFPRMSRHAANDRPRLIYEYSFAIKALLILAAPIIAATVWFAPALITVVTGGKGGYLPESALVLQILIFFLPFSFINGVIQYVLIALDRQRLITRAFAATALFNVAANLLLVPAVGIYGAAATTVLSELVLLAPFLVWTGRELAPVPLLSLSIKPLVGGIVAGLLAWLLWPLEQGWAKSWGDFALYVGAGILLLLVYAGVMLALRPFTPLEASALRGVFRRNRQQQVVDQGD